MEDYLISRILRKFIAPIVAILLMIAVVYGWLIGDPQKAFKQLYWDPMQYIGSLMIKPKLDKLQNRLENISTQPEDREQTPPTSSSP